MTRRVNLYKIITVISFYSILFVILFLKWAYNLSPKWIIVLSSFMLFVLGLKTNIQKKKWIICLIVMFVYFIINLLFTNEHTYFWDSVFNYTVFPFCSVIYMYLLIKNDDMFLKKYINKPLFFIFNIYYLINSIIIFKQINIPWFMVRNYSDNLLYVDHIAGLIGSNGTARLMIFNIVCLLLNYSYINDNNKLTKILARIFFIVVLIISLYISLFNDSRFYYVLLLLFFIPIILKYYSNSIKKNVKKILLSIMVLSFVFILYLTNSEINTLVNEKFIDNYINKTTQKINSNGEISEERIILLKKAIEEGDGLLLGKGIGAIPGNGGNYYKHFGLNDFNVRIYTGGIVFAIIISLMYNSSFMDIAFDNKQSRFKKVYFLIVIIILGCYSNFFTYEDKSMLIALLFYMYRIIYKNNLLEEENSK